MSNANQEKIDTIDREILALVDQRIALVKQEARSVKQSAGSSQPSPTQPITGRVASSSHHIDEVVAAIAERTEIAEDASATAAETQRQILRHIASVCLAAVDPIRVAFLGPEYSYSHLASLKYFGLGAEFTPVGSIPAVFEAVARGDVATGLVPIENSTDGGVVDTLGMFVRCQMQICGEVVLPIHHNLLSSSPRESITEIHSKPQALSQCRGYLATHFPGARLVETTSTTAAAQLAAEKSGVAAVASLEAGRQYDLDVLAANIEDNPHNVTRFAVLGKDRPESSGDDKTSLLFKINHQPGTLADVMMIFKNNQLNMTWIESFPCPDTRNEYLFFVELSGHRDDPTVADAIEMLSRQAKRLDILGSYPKAAP
ncbi:Prephenate dehydratase [Novipirellula galeiformis]|uniref:prephenate dehydratase n=1 Tax=Novipirellula galeiformis TaxID=2528004 RepID=A0A5C6CCJ6_9BACT|nr:prephenate dehydratase [Novipirellula galeiformis]TWU21191.1 Prephenate dehydratase [Novipirellula galeiformis]